MSRIQLSQAEICILTLLLENPKTWTQLRTASGLSRQGLVKALRSLSSEQGWISVGRVVHRKAVVYSVPASSRSVVKRHLMGEPLNAFMSTDRYSDLESTVRQVVMSGEDDYAQYLMLHYLFTGWGNAHLEQVDDNLVWAMIALLGKQESTYRDMRSAAEFIFRKTMSFIFSMARKYPVVAMAFIDSAKNEDISDVIDDSYDEIRFLQGVLPTRSEIVREATHPLYQFEVPSLKQLKSHASEMRTRYSKHREYPVRSKKEIEQILDFVGDLKFRVLEQY